MLYICELEQKQSLVICLKIICLVVYSRVATKICGSEGNGVKKW